MKDAAGRVELRGLAKSYPGGIEAVAGIDLTVGAGEFLAIVGPSGSGKSTLLRMIAGLEPASSGSLMIGGRSADDLAPRDRDIAMVFQNTALYPHLDVFANMAFGLRARRFPRSEVRSRVEEAARWLGLADCLRRMPKALSGGERQRVALGRAIARRPKVLLLDEPLSNLDAPLRAAIRADLIDLHRRSSTTMIQVTHDQAEALAMGDRVAVLIRGRLLQVGTPREVYDRPECRPVAEFLGSPPMNILPCEVITVGETVRIRVVGIEPEAAVEVVADGAWAMPLRVGGPGPIDLGIRAEHVALGSIDEPNKMKLEGEIRRLEPIGHETLATLAVGPHTLTIRIAPDAGLGPGDRAAIRLDLTRAVWFESESGDLLGLSRLERKAPLPKGEEPDWSPLPAGEG